MKILNGKISNGVYIIAALAGAGLIIYGTLFYTKSAPKSAPKEAGILSQVATQKSTQKSEEIILGHPNAPVTMIEYGSYLCGHCVNFARYTMPQIEENYIKTNKVKFIYRSYPPLELGMAALCANEQGKFWQYHDYLFQRNIQREEDLKQYALEIGLNGDEFNQCLDSEKYKQKAENWYKLGQEQGIEGTPTFFINDQKIVGNLPYEEFKKVIEEELAKHSSR